MSEAVPTVGGSFLERLSELFHGMPEGAPTWVTSGGPEGGLLAAIAKLDADQASTLLGNTSIAAHVNHLVFAVGLVNRWAEGQEPTSDWASSWTVKQVDDAAWRELQASLRHEADLILAGPASQLDWTHGEPANYGFSTLAHTAYHLGAIKHMITQVQ